MANSNLSEQHDSGFGSKSGPFLLRFQQPLIEGASPTKRSAIQAGTMTVTEVCSEAGDADPTTRAHFAIHRRGFEDV